MHFSRSHFFILISLFLFDISYGKTSLPFHINGPKSYTDKIVIVGAGASGIDMALRLKNLNFSNVEILEKEKTIGGKSWSIGHRGAPQEMAAVYLAPDYEENVIPLVEKYVPGDLVYLPPASIWLDKLPGPISYEVYLVRYVMEYFGTRNTTVAITRMAQAVKKYIFLHNEIFQEYEGDLMPEPTKEVLNRTRGTFLDFLRRNNIEVIAPILYASNSVQGYGRIDEIACLYGMMWNTPKLMNGLLKRLTGQTNQTDNTFILWIATINQSLQRNIEDFVFRTKNEFMLSVLYVAFNEKEKGLYMLKSGFEHLWKTIVQKEHIKVTTSVRILKVFRNHNYSKVLIKKGVKGGVHWEQYDFLIWSPEMQTSLKLWSNPEIYDELYYFNLTVPTYFTTALLDTEGAQKGSSPIDYWFDNINNKSRDGSIWAQRDSYAAINGFDGEKYVNGSFPTGNDCKKVRSTVTYQMSDREPFYTQLRHILKESMNKIGVKSMRIIKMKTWRYFPRFTPSDMEKGYLWRILEMQGRYGMWYIGSSVSFESVKSVIEYNKLLLKNMKPVN